MASLRTSGPFHLSGQRFGRWLVVAPAARNKSGNIQWKCICDCGMESFVLQRSLRQGQSHGCRDCANRLRRSSEPYEERNKRYQAAYRRRNVEGRRIKLAEWRKQNPDLVARRKRATNYRIKYGLKVEEVEAMHAQQSHRCAICKSAITLGGRSNAKVDHDHLTGRVRGILCSRCNTALGSFRDSEDILQAALDYLKHSRLKLVKAA